MDGSTHTYLNKRRDAARHLAGQLGCTATRITHQIGRRSGSVILHSDRVAIALGRELNTEVIFRYWKTDLPRDDMSRFFREDMRGRRFAYWSRPIKKRRRVERNGPPTDVWVAENKGHPHVHWCLHLRPECTASFREYLRKLWRSVPALAAVPFDELFRVREVYDYTKYKLYLSKGIDPRYGKAWNVRVLSDQGEVVGKRSGVSANLTRAARKHLGL